MPMYPADNQTVTADSIREAVDDGADIIGHDDGQVTMSSIDRNSGFFLPVTVQVMLVRSTIISSV